jgi:hypothetical protein
VFILLCIRSIHFALIQKQPLKEETIKSDPFIEDVMHYAFTRNIQPLAMPGIEGKNTLFDSTKEGIQAVCELFTTTHKQGTKGYNELFQRLKDEIDHYCENKLLIREKIVEQHDKGK